MEGEDNAALAVLAERASLPRVGSPAVPVLPRSAMITNSAVLDSPPLLM